MKRRCIRLLVLLWFGWYLSGPLLETVDFWDSPQEEMNDVARSAGGAATLIAAVLCFEIVVLRKLRERCRHLATAVRRRFLPLTFETPVLLPRLAPAVTHSPPLPLRI